MVAPIHTGPGLYVVTLTNEHPISVNADRPAGAEGCIKVTRANCKFGKAENLSVRRRNYFKTFGEQFVCFHPLAALDNPASVEAQIGERLYAHRILGATGRPNEWLEGISPQRVEEIIFAVLEEAAVPYVRLGSVGKDVSRA